MNEESSNIVTFPISNKRFDLENIELDQDDIAEKIKLIKMTYFSDIADSILDNVIRSISLLNLSSSSENNLTSTDIILLKETIISTMCKLSGLEHPLHKIAIDNIIINGTESDSEDIYFKYTFKESNEKSEKKEEI